MFLSVFGCSSLMEELKDYKIVIDQPSSEIEIVTPIKETGQYRYQYSETISLDETVKNMAITEYSLFVLFSNSHFNVTTPLEVFVDINKPVAFKISSEYQYILNQSRISVFNNEALVKTIGTQGLEDGYFKQPVDFELYQGRIYVLDNYKKNVQVFNKSHCFEYKFGQHGADRGEFNVPQAISINEYGIFVADYKKIMRFDFEGRLIKEFSSSYIRDIVVNRDLVFVLQSNGVWVYNINGEFLYRLDNLIENGGNLDSPQYIEFNNNYIYVSDGRNLILYQ